jgi:hypothetical protein
MNFNISKVPPTGSVVRVEVHNAFLRELDEIWEWLEDIGYIRRLDGGNNVIYTTEETATMLVLRFG